MSQHPSIAHIRKDYIQASLDEAEAGNEPFSFFKKWFAEADSAKVLEINAMTLATVDAQSRPHARIVLLKAIDDLGFTFFTNYQSNKGKELAANGNAALLFFWAELERQVRIEGIISQVTDEESDAYYLVRPRGSRLGAWASPQSSIIPNRQYLEDNEQKFQVQFEGQDIPRPAHWGGYRLIPTRIEFWQGRASRLHDRICFELDANNTWQKSRLAP